MVQFRSSWGRVPFKHPCANQRHSWNDRKGPVLLFHMSRLVGLDLPFVGRTHLPFTGHGSSWTKSSVYHSIQLFLNALIVEKECASAQSNEDFYVFPELSCLESIHLPRLIDTNRQLPQVFCFWASHFSTAHLLRTWWNSMGCFLFTQLTKKPSKCFW